MESDKKKLGLKLVQAFPNCPFKVNGIKLVPVFPRKDRVNKDHVDEDTGEIKSGLWTPSDNPEPGDIKIKDDTMFVKLYRDVKNPMKLHEMSSVALKIVDFVLANLQPNTVEIQITAKDILGDAHRRHYHRYSQAMYELWTANFLAKKLSSDPIFFINPNYVFNGDRYTVALEIQKQYNQRMAAIRAGTYNRLYGGKSTPIKPNEDFPDAPPQEIPQRDPDDNCFEP